MADEGLHHVWRTCGEKLDWDRIVKEVEGLSKEEVDAREMPVDDKKRMEDIEECTKQKYTEYPDAWVLLDTVVTETLTFGSSTKLRNVTGKRTLSIRSPEPAPLVADEVMELF